MRKDRNIEKIIDCIKIIEQQINDFKQEKSLFCKKQNINRIEKLEEIKMSLYKILE